MVRTIALLSLLVSACIQAPDFPTLPDQAAAAAIVWKHTYHADGDAPAVDWIIQDKLNCFFSARTNTFHGFWLDGACVGGVTWVYPWYVEVAHYTDYQYHEEVFAHEFFHAYLYMTTGQSDPDHVNPGFGLNYGHPYGIVDQADDNLQAAGL